MRSSAIGRLIGGLLAFSVFAAVVLASSAGAEDDPNARSAGSPSAYWGAYIDGFPGDTAKIDAFEAQAGKRASIIHWGQPWWHCDDACGYQGFQAQYFDSVRNRGSIPMVNWGSWDYSDG